ncbi:MULTISPECIES: DUF1700 domain-containing protein [Streptococcus]|jgi:uncharacterized membrane protein|uniref:DUF1700 domain-containing protein n=1 Tax=Streptococcus salivarius TaxID=1304 RepID=A0A1V0H7F4_STRSL|nr:MULTISPECIES: DUF1700 domain-containing protein [Streptococcus]ARC48778.1 DUF1700 domain-containing protein [Streptococcus salivarius]EUC63506.1 PF08006 family protein [Streptococcus sp. ACS2]MDU5046285.1 DUF1700 domain-containing protein [Streptococcus sp.]MDU8044788.1 DUF1700 domain-containing protein [Streptococcus sp.]MTQ90234.1 DUF1700 domain-containing protein [Streptococcus salivarius]
MTKTEYIAKLTKYLRKLPQQDYEEAIEYFMEYFEEAGPENEARVIAELGTPKEAAHEVISRLLEEKIVEDKSSLRNKTTILWIAILAVLASPVALPILLFFLAMIVTLLMIIFAVIVTALALTFALLISGVYTFFTSFSLLSVSLASTLFGGGLGLLMFGGALLLLLISFEICKLIVKLITLLIKWLIKKGRKS